MENKIKTLFLDIGGVLLSNGWDRNARQRSRDKFGLDKEEMENRHALIFDTYELGKATFEDYLHFTIFHVKRDFTVQEFKTFMYEQSTPIEGAIEYFTALKKQHGFKVVALSNEPRDLNEYRIEKFKLKELFDFFISSCYVHLRKPDAEIFTLALDTSQANKENSLYVDDRLLYIEMARSLSIPSLHYQNLDSAKEYFTN
jgi:putative hydrolase of the HAD superfamily